MFYLCFQIQGYPENNGIGRRHYNNTSENLMLLESQ